ncbi:MAG: tetratricopeptide repeat protein [Treponema sp.]|nr:tetratricopeptide repeat protein [Treponema sp.]
MMKRIFSAAFLLLCSFLLSAQPAATLKKSQKTQKTPASKKEKEAPAYVFSQDFADGEELFQLNRPLEAIPLFEKIIDDKNINPAVFVYLGVAYYQVEEYQKSLNICVRGLTRPDTDHKVLAYNGGNSAYALGNYARADACYAIAIKEDPDFSAAYLNRANAQLKQDHLEDARANYQKFIEMESENEQRPAIEQLIALLDAEILRRANEKPELIRPEDMNVGNQDMKVPENIEKIALEELPAREEKTEAEEVPEKIAMEEIAAPELPPEELHIESDESERVSVENDIPAEEKPKSAKEVVEETVVHEAEKDILEAEEAARRQREKEKTVEEEIEIPVLPEPNPKPKKEDEQLERIQFREPPAARPPHTEKPVTEVPVTDAK